MRSKSGIVGVTLVRQDNSGTCRRPVKTWVLSQLNIMLTAWGEPDFPRPEPITLYGKSEDAVKSLHEDAGVRQRDAFHQECLIQ